MSEANEGAVEAVAQDTTAADQVAEETLAQGDEQSGDDAAAATDEGEGQQPKPKKSAQERINELTAARREAERDRDFYREQALRFQQSQQQEPPRRQEPEADPEPDPNDYDHGELDARFIRDHATYYARLAFREEMRAARAAEENERNRAEIERRASELSEKHPDFYDVVGDNFSKVSPLLTEAMGLALSNTPEGVELAYHIAKNPAEARRIAALPPIAQAVELGKIAARLNAPNGARTTPKTATDAPEPPPQARGTGGRFTVAPDTDDFAAFDKNY